MQFSLILDQDEKQKEESRKVENRGQHVKNGKTLRCRSVFQVDRQLTSLGVSQDAPGYHANREAIALLEQKDGLPALKKLKQVLPPGCEEGMCRCGIYF